MKKRTETETVAGKKTTWYILEDQSGLCAKSMTRDYRRLRKILTEQLKQR